MKYVPLILCVSMAIWPAPSLAQTKQSSLMQPGATILLLNKMCQEKPNGLQYTVCVAYLRGLFDGMQQAKMVEKTKDTFCPPANSAKTIRRPCRTRRSRCPNTSKEIIFYLRPGRILARASSSEFRDVRS
jgi:hypothetical protein